MGQQNKRIQVDCRNDNELEVFYIFPHSVSMLIHMHSSNMLLGSTPSACVPPQCCQQQNISTFRVWLVQIRFVSAPPFPEPEHKYLTRQHVRVRSYIMATVGFQRLPPVLCQFARVSEYPYLAVCFVRAW